jgi:hypothetical protein
MPSEQVVEQCVRPAKVRLAQAFDSQSKIGQAVPRSEFEDAERASHAQAFTAGGITPLRSSMSSRSALSAMPRLMAANSPA